MTSKPSTSHQEEPAVTEDGKEGRLAAERLLRKACAEGRLPEVQRLLLLQVSSKARNESGSTPLHEAAFNGHTGTCELLLEARAQAGELDNWSASALHHAAARGHQAVAELLIAHRTDVNASNYSRQMPIDLALARGHQTLADLLAEEAMLRHQAARKQKSQSLWTVTASSVGLGIAISAGLYVSGFLGEARSA
eukprot:TRINITY_DN77236_c0_g1_i1.p1 TRINITY_DN77236_c0_g1~~TRINITY_DN77236_c0_g1_i1.p1  ORF type:complete len:202 (+),score=49.45 TRINITY_DN77236_c0_g1_i1:27-608(+)